MLLLQAISQTPFDIHEFRRRHKVVSDACAGNAAMKKTLDVLKRSIEDVIYPLFKQRNYTAVNATKKEEDGKKIFRESLNFVLDGRFNIT